MIHCPTCGGGVRFDIKSQMLVCDHCDNSYEVTDIRFIIRIDGASAHDDVGATAMDAVENAVSEFENEEFTALWNKLKGE